MCKDFYFDRFKLLTTRWIYFLKGKEKFDRFCLYLSETNIFAEENYFN